MFRRLMFALSNLSNAREFGQYIRLRDNLMNGRSEAVEEFADFSASHANAAEVLAHHGYVGSAGKAKLVDFILGVDESGSGAMGGKGMASSDGHL